MHKYIQNLHFIFILIVLLCNNSASAAAWTQKKGSGQIILSLSNYGSSDYFDSNKKSQSSNVSFNKLEFNPFIEYGFSDDLTIGATPTIQLWRFDKENASSNIFDFRQCGIFNGSNTTQVNATMIETELFIRKKLLDKNNFVLSAQPLIKTPCIYIQNGNVQLLENTTDIELRLLAGYGFKWDPDLLFGSVRRPFSGQHHFMDFEVAYRKRNSQFSDQIKFDTTLGFRARNNLLFLGQVFSTFSTGDEPIRGVFSNGQLLVEKDDFYTAKAQISAIQQVTNDTSLQISFFKEILGKNAGDGSGALVSVWYGF